MNALIAIALVCSVATPVEDCSRETTLDIIASPANSPVECLLHAQATAAAAGLPGGEGRYLKVGCERRVRLGEAQP